MLERLRPAHLNQYIVLRRELRNIDLLEWNKLYWESTHYEKVNRDRDGSTAIGGARKYFDLKRFLSLNIKRYHALKIRKKQQVIVDLGCGGGFFVYYAIRQGHYAVGLDRGKSADFDTQGPPVYDLMTNFFQIPKIKHTILPYQPLPSNIQNADLITGFNTWFDGKYGENRTYAPWTLEEWKFFFEDLKGRLNPAGRIVLEVNEKWEYKLGYYLPEGFREMLGNLGFRINRLDKGWVDVSLQGEFSHDV